MGTLSGVGREPDPLAAALMAAPRAGAKRIVPARTKEGRPAVRKDWPDQPGSERLAHEAGILAQLAGVPGVPQLAEPFDDTALMIEQFEAVALAGVWPGRPLEQATLLRVATGLGMSRKT